MTFEVTRRNPYLKENHLSKMSGPIIIVDDHEAIFLGVKMVLNKMGFTNLIGQSDLNGLTKLIHDKKPVLLIMDVEFPEKESLAVLSSVLDLSPDLKVIIYSKHQSPSVVSRYLKAGASGFINKLTPLSDIGKGIQKVLDGKRYVDEITAEVLINLPLEKEAITSLSDREYEVFRLLIQNNTYKEISEKAGITINTVGTYKTRISEKLGVRTREEMKELAKLHDLEF